MGVRRSVKKLHGVNQGTRAFLPDMKKTADNLRCLLSHQGQSEEYTLPQPLSIMVERVKHCQPGGVIHIGPGVTNEWWIEFLPKYLRWCQLS